MAKKGERVGAILGSAKGTVQFLGYGVYEGDAVPTEAVGQFAEMMIETNIPNPKISLDSGKVVYGCECWWGPEESVKARLAKFEKVEDVDIDKVREDYRKAMAEQEKKPE